MFTKLYLELRAIPDRLRLAWRHNRLHFFQFVLFWGALLVFLINRLLMNVQAIDVAVVLGVPFVSFVAVEYRLGRIGDVPKTPLFDAMVLHPVRSALWLQLLGSFSLLLQRTAGGPASFDEIFLWIFVLPIEWILFTLLKRKLAPHTQAKLAVVFVIVYGISFLFFTLASTA
jgi:hypothetical protein